MERPWASDAVGRTLRNLVFSEEEDDDDGEEDDNC